MSPRLLLLLVGGFIAGVGAALALTFALTGVDDRQPPQRTTLAASLATGESPTSTPLPSSSATPEAEAETPPADESAERTCEEIRADGAYRGDSERQRFLRDCGPAPSSSTPRPAAVEIASPASAPVTSTPIPARASSPAADISGRIELIGAVWPDEALPVRYCVNADEMPVRSDGAKLMSAAAFAQVVQTAFATWEALPDSGIAFAYQASAPTIPGTIGTGSTPLAGAGSSATQSASLTRAAPTAASSVRTAPVSSSKSI